MLLKQITIKKIILILSISMFSNTVFADRIKDFADIAGQRPNQLVGYGLVVGLDGTGDQTTQTPFYFTKRIANDWGPWRYIAIDWNPGSVAKYSSRDGNRRVPSAC
jgi:hypothetical protein